MKTEAKYVIANLRNYTSWDFKCYPLQKAEAEALIEEFDRLHKEGDRNEKENTDS